MNIKFRAAIFDLDGVITETARVHAAAWKRMFDEYNERRISRGEQPYSEFTIAEDYKVYIDGKPRYNGVKSFFQSRDVEIPYGTPDDEPGKETICGLGNLKNKYFNALIRENGINPLEANVQKAREWKINGLKVAIISSSKNCSEILNAAGIDDLFDIQIDGKVSAERDLQGKPAPDIFLEAARDLKVSPQETIVIEDSLAGVEAAFRGYFRLVIGIDDGDRKSELLQRGADIVVENLEEVDIFNDEKLFKKELPNALDHINLIIKDIQKQNTLLCLDYDGTLTPIVEDYRKATLSEEMKKLLIDCAKVFPVAVVSGRDIKFIQEQVGLQQLYYAGSHGFEIEGPENFRYEVEAGRAILPILDKAEKELHNRTKLIKGVEIERKRYAIAVHYRHVQKDDVDYLENVVGDLLEEYPNLKKGGGKKVFELKPNINWDKGKAIEVLSQQILNNDKKTMIYIGDDETDEDAFRVIKNGYGILVGHPGQETFATFYLNDVEGVREFLNALKSHYDER